MTQLVDTQNNSADRSAVEANFFQKLAQLAHCLGQFNGHSGLAVN